MQEGYAHSFVIEGPFHVLETIVCCARRRFIPLCVGLLPQLEKEVDVQVTEQSSEPPYEPQRTFEVGEMERDLLASALWEHEGLLNRDRRVYVSIKDPENPYPGEIRLVPPGMLVLFNLPKAVPFIADQHRIPLCRDEQQLIRLPVEECPLLPDFEERLHIFLRQINAEES